MTDLAKWWFENWRAALQRRPMDPSYGDQPPTPGEPHLRLVEDDDQP
jgi:hypothetical protein